MLDERKCAHLKPRESEVRKDADFLGHRDLNWKRVVKEKKQAQCGTWA